MHTLVYMRMKTLIDMQFKAISVSKELQSVSMQEAEIMRRIKLSEAIENQIKEISSPDTNNTNKISNEISPTIWRGVGKMFLSTSMENQIESMIKERKEYKDQLSALEKKHNYLEHTYKNLTGALQNLMVKD